MTRVCRICLALTRGEEDYHARCARALFGSTSIPRLDIEVSKLHTAALAMVGHTSLLGIQKKISVNLAVDRQTLQVAAEGGRYILKPQTETYPSLPENEHLTTRLAELVDVEVGRCGLIPLKDGSLAYLMRRFDRLPDGRKVRQEDFCQLSELSPKDKYDSSAERCAKLLHKYATEPLIEILKFYRLMVFTWWSGNGDMHLKNFSLLVDENGFIRLTPAYDLLCTRLVIADDQLALSVGGKKDNLRRNLWLEFARYCQLPEKSASRVLQEQADALPAALDLIDRSFLPAEMKTSYRQLVEERSELLVAK